MAHCLQFEGTTFICNSDLSGYVTIVPGLPSRAEVSVPCEAADALLKEDPSLGSEV